MRRISSRFPLDAAYEPIVELARVLKPRHPTVIPPACRITRRSPSCAICSCGDCKRWSTRVEAVELFRSRMDERGLVPEDIRSLDDIVQASLHAEERSARHLSIRAFRQPHEGCCSTARLQRNHRQAHRRGLHARRYRRVDLGAGALFCRLRAASRRYHADRLWLRPLHRRPGRTLRCRGAGRYGGSRLPAATPTGRSC